MTTTAPPTIWEVPRESDEFVGPITLTVTVAGVPVTFDPDAVKFAVLPDRARPGDDDWADPVDDPHGSGTGVRAAPVTMALRYGIWAQLTDNPFTPVLEPAQVGYIDRT